jgi:hypothetical protein
VSTHIDGTPPSVTPGPGDDDPAGYRRGPDHDPEPDGDSGSVWLHEEIQRRIAAGRRASKGRHARHEVASSTTSISYVPRHSTATPGPGASPPAPVATPARGMPRVPAAWSSPPTPAVPAAEPPADLRPDPETGPPPGSTGAEGHRRTTPAGGGAVVPGGGSAAPSPFRSGDPLPAAAARKVIDRVTVTPPADGAPEPAAPEPVASKRVRVVLAERKAMARPVRTVVDIQEGNGVGELLRSNLIGSQLTVALRFAVGAVVTLGVLPVLFWMFPVIGRTEVLGLPVPWLLLGILVYPFLLGLGLWHTRTAERVEQNFADHVQD